MFQTLWACRNPLLAVAICSFLQNEPVYGFCVVLCERMAQIHTTSSLGNAKTPLTAYLLSVVGISACKTTRLHKINTEILRFPLYGTEQTPHSTLCSIALPHFGQFTDLICGTIAILHAHAVQTIVSSTPISFSIVTTAPFA